MKIVKRKILKVDLAKIPLGMTINEWLDLFKQGVVIYDGERIVAKTSKHNIEVLEVEFVYLNLFEKLWYSLKKK